jgi:hypothetical protein
MTLDPTLAAHVAARNAEFRRTQGDQIANQYLDDVLMTRAAAFPAHLATMAVSSDMVLWALAMAGKWGQFVKVHHYIADWLTALLVVRYGEEPDASKTWDGKGWPQAFSDDDRVRAAELLAGKGWPTSITTLSTEE